MIIYVEGLSGSGKTTLLKSIKNNKALVVSEFIGEYGYISQLDNKEAMKQLTAQICMKNDEAKSAEATKLNSEDTFVFVDRSYMSTLVYETSKEFMKKHKYSSIPVWDWYRNFINLIKPDLYVLIHAPSNDIITRWGKAPDISNNSLDEDAWHKDHHFVRFMYDYCFAFEREIPIMEFDNSIKINSDGIKSERTSTELFEEVKMKLKRLGKIS